MSITDNDECVMGTDTCDQVCINEPGSYHCSCNTGYLLKSNKISCMGKLIRYNSFFNKKI